MHIMTLHFDMHATAREKRARFEQDTSNMAAHDEQGKTDILDSYIQIK